MRACSRVVAAVTAVFTVSAQQLPYRIQNPAVPFPVRPYMQRALPPLRTSNSVRLRDLIRAGKIYLTVQDAVALAIENNLDLEVDRYGPLIAQSAYLRSLGGGTIRGVPSAPAQIASADAGLGVNGSTLSAGLNNGNGGTGNTTTGGASIQQIGPITPNLDPVLQNTTTFSHLTQPFANTIVSGTTALVQSVHTYNTVLQQGLITGGYLQFRSFEQYLDENSPTDLLNPAVGPHMDLSIRHNLLKGFGANVNGRFIRVAQKNATASFQTFRAQLLDLTASVLNLYWDLVTAGDTLRSRQQALAIAQKFYNDTKAEIQLGVLARFELTRAEAEAASRRQDVVVAQQVVVQQEALLKQALTRDDDETVRNAEIVTLDRIEVPAEDNLPPLRALLKIALEKRPDVVVAKIKDETAEINALGTANGLLPTLQVSAQTFNRGAAGTPQIPGEANQYFVGGYGTALGQIFRRNFPNNEAGVFLSIPFLNRQAQADYGIDQLQMRQGTLSARRDLNQIVVDISNQMVAMRQARVRYSTAADARALQQQLLEKTQLNFQLGNAELNDLIVAQRSLAEATTAEITAQSDYSHARVALDQVLGETLEKTHVTLEEGLAGRVARQPSPPPSAAR